MAARPAVAPTWGGTQTEPSGGQKSAGYSAGDRPAAQHLNWLLDNFADWVNYLDTDYLTAVPRLAADVPVIASSENAHDHPGSASNKWKLIVQGELHTGTYVRLYAGDESAAPGGLWVITWNALWNAASGDQFWTKDDTAKVSLALLCDAGGLNWRSRAAGAGSFTTWTSGTGDLQCGGDLTVGDDLFVTGDSTIPTMLGSVDIAGALDVGTDIFAADDVIAGDAFQYGAPLPTRSVLIPLMSGFGEGTITAPSPQIAVAFAGAGETHCWPIRVPQGAVLASVQALVAKAGGGTMTLRTMITTSFDFSASPGGPTATSAVGTNTETGSGVQQLDATWSSTTVDNTDTEYMAHITSGDGGDAIYGLLVTWTDPGPRNH